MVNSMNNQRDALAELMASIHSDADSDKKQIEDAATKDGQICKFHLAGMCPRKLLEGARLGKELGLCGKRHDDRLRDFYREYVSYVFYCTKFLWFESSWV